MKNSKLIKNKCEIESCNISDPAILELHHIIHRTEENTTNNEYNLAVLCPNHHSFLHSGRLNIIGVYPSTNPPNGRTLIYVLDGEKNIDIDGPYVEFKNKSFKIFGDKE